MAIDYKVLQTELLTDPQKVGYKTPIDKGDDVGTAALVNTPSLSDVVNREPITPPQLFGAIDPSEFFGLTSIQLQQLQCVLTGNVDLNDASSEKILFNILGPNSVAALQVLQKRAGSRSEALFGAKIVVTPTDVSIALRETK